MERLYCIRLPFFLGLTDHVQGNAINDVLLGANTVNSFLHFAMATVAALHGIGGGRQQFIVEESQGFLQVGRINADFRKA
jgi:hypothetical protein